MVNRPQVFYSKNGQSGNLIVDLEKTAISIGVYNCTAETTLKVGSGVKLVEIVIDGIVSDGFSDEFFAFTHFEIETTGTYDLVVRGLWI